jgi:hypothetical protein
MPFIRARRMVAGVAVVSAVLAAAPAPAAAAPVAADISVYVADVTVSARAAAGTPISPVLRAATAVTLDQPTVTYETRGLSGMSVTGAESADCDHETPSKLICAGPSTLEVGPEGGSAGFVAYVRAGDDGEVGNSGTVEVTLSARGITPITVDAALHVVDQIDLQAGPDRVSEAAPGGVVDPPLVITNAAGGSITGAAVLFDHDFALATEAAAYRYRNCLYADGRLASCVFDQALAPGRTYAAALPLTVRADTAAPGAAYGYRQWLKPHEYKEFLDYLQSRDISPGTPGIGVVLALTEVPAVPAAPAGAGAADNWTSVRVDVTGKNDVNLAAVGAGLTGAAGDKITLPVGVRNVGAATLDRVRLGSPAAVTAVTVPPGTTVVGAPNSCYPVVGGGDDLGAPGTPGAARYRCHSDPLLVASTGETYRFELRIDTITGRTTGTVAVNEPCECERFADDVDPSNNTAPIVITAGTAAGDEDEEGDDGDDSPDGDQDAGSGNGQGGGSGSDTPGLPITGPQGATLAGTGIALLAFGVGLLLLAHRLRRFVG